MCLTTLAFDSAEKLVQLGECRGLVFVCSLNNHPYRSIYFTGALVCNIIAVMLLNVFQFVSAGSTFRNPERCSDIATVTVSRIQDVVKR